MAGMRISWCRELVAIVWAGVSGCYRFTPGLHRLLIICASAIYVLLEGVQHCRLCSDALLQCLQEQV
jgi:hypothetical protein